MIKYLTQFLLKCTLPPEIDFFTYYFFFCFNGGNDTAIILNLTVEKKCITARNMIHVSSVVALFTDEII